MSINAMMNPMMYPMMNPMYNSYMTQAGLYDMYNGGSIFGMMPSFTGMNYDSYFNNMKNYLNFTSDYNLQLVENQRRNELRINAVDEGIRSAASVLNDKIKANEQEQILGAFENLVNAVARKYPGETEKDIINRAKSSYQSIYDTSINNDIRANGNGSFKQGLYQVLSFGLANNVTAEENIAALTGQPEAKSSKIEKALGRATGGALMGGGAVLALSQLKWLKCLKGKWAVLGMIAGGLAASITGLRNIRTP